MNLTIDTRYVPDKDTKRLLYAWLFFAISSLIFAGLFAFLVVMARTPVIQDLFPRTDYVRVALVSHVILSFVIWFLAFKGLLWTLAGTVLLGAGQFSKTAGWTGYLLSVAGMLSIVITAVLGLGAPQFINYIPVLTHPLFYAGLLLLFAGITMTLLNTFLTIGKAKRTGIFQGRLPLPTFGMIIAGIAFTSAVTCFGLSFYFQVIAPSGQRPVSLEGLFWGGGHVLQFANTIAMITAWLFLTYLVFREFPLRESYSRPLYAFYLIFILPAPLIYFIFDTNSRGYTKGFTSLMEYGLGPSTVIFSVAILAMIGSKRLRELPWKRPEFSSLLLSMALFALGGVISFKIYGYNTKIPSHYHGVIGGVTLAFMGLTNYVLTILNKEVCSRKMAALHPYVYGTGQALFVLGMFWAGSHGVARKTFGAAQNLDNIAKVLGMAIVGIGGIIAIIGGIMFIVNSVMSMIQTSARRHCEVAEANRSNLITSLALAHKDEN